MYFWRKKTGYQSYKFGSLLKNKHSLKLSAAVFLWVIRHLGNSTKQIQVHGGHQTCEVAVTVEGPPNAGGTG